MSTLHIHFGVQQRKGTSITLDNKCLLTLCFRAISYSFRGAEHEYDNENSKLATVSKESAKVYYIFKKYVHQTCNDKSPLLLATSLCLPLVSVMKFALSIFCLCGAP
jgi:hypothetical protein